MARASLSGSRLKVLGSMSTNTGVAPRRLITSAVAKKVKGVVKIASPGPTFSAIRAMSRESVPDAQPIQCLTPTNSASLFSNSLISGPIMYLP